VSYADQIIKRGVALTSRLQFFETELLAQAENLAGLAGLNRKPVASIHLSAE